MRDLLSHTERFVHEVKGSQILKRRDCVLARVVDHDGISVFCSMHPRGLPPSEAEHVVREGRRMCGVRTRAVPIEKLRDVEVQLELIDFWHLNLEELDTPCAFPQLANTDGDPLLMTTDHFDFDSANRASPRPQGLRLVRWRGHCAGRLQAPRARRRHMGNPLVHFELPGAAPVGLLLRDQQLRQL